MYFSNLQPKMCGNVVKPKNWVLIKFFFILLTKDKLLMEEMKVSELLYHMLKVLVRGHQ